MKKLTQGNRSTFFSTLKAGEGFTYSTTTMMFLEVVNLAATAGYRVVSTEDHKVFRIETPQTVSMPKRHHLAKPATTYLVSRQVARAEAREFGKDGNGKKARRRAEKLERQVDALEGRERAFQSRQPCHADAMKALRQYRKRAKDAELAAFIKKSQGVTDTLRSIPADIF